MRVCAAQYDIVWEDKSANMRICENFFCKAKKYGAELLVFPEMSLTGFTMDKSLSESANGSTESKKIRCGASCFS